MERHGRSEQIGRFETEDRLGHGGMGAVYLARDPHLGRRVAIKVIQADIDSPDARDRFLREARSIAALNHPNIVNVYESGESDGRPYLVLEYIEGRTLAAMIRARETPPLAERVRWLEELCDGLQFAHDRGIIHRDIKPANLMVDHLRRLRILDFGIAKIVGSDHTQLSSMVGTAAYMAPEYISGEESDYRIDLFAAGAVAYELVTLRPAFAGKTQSGVIQKVMECAPSPLGGAADPIDQELEQIVLRSLRRNPDERYQSGNALRDAFRGVRLRLEREALNRDMAPTETVASAVAPTAVVHWIARPAANDPLADSNVMTDGAVMAGGTIPVVPTRPSAAAESRANASTFFDTAIRQRLRASSTPAWLATTVRYAAVAAIVLPVVAVILGLGGFFAAAPEPTGAETSRPPATPSTAVLPLPASTGAGPAAVADEKSPGTKVGTLAGGFRVGETLTVETKERRTDVSSTESLMPRSLSVDAREGSTTEVTVRAGAGKGVGWVTPKNGELTTNAVLGGVDLTDGVNKGTPLYVCRASYENGLHPGKLIAGRCHIGYGGQEVQRQEYEVAVGQGKWSREGTDGALIGGFENGAPLHVCRVRYATSQPIDSGEIPKPRANAKVIDRGWHPGKLLPNGHCYIGYGGVELNSTDYELFYPN